MMDEVKEGITERGEGWMKDKNIEGMAERAEEWKIKKRKEKEKVGE